MTGLRCGAGGDWKANEELAQIDGARAAAGKVYSQNAEHGCRTSDLGGAECEDGAVQADRRTAALAGNLRNGESQYVDANIERSVDQSQRRLRQVEEERAATGGHRHARQTLAHCQCGGIRIVHVDQPAVGVDSDGCARDGFGQVEAGNAGSDRARSANDGIHAIVAVDRRHLAIQADAAGRRSTVAGENDAGGVHLALQRDGAGRLRLRRCGTQQRGGHRQHGDSQHTKHAGRAQLEQMFEMQLHRYLLVMTQR